MVEVCAYEGSRLLSSLQLQIGKSYTIGREPSNDLSITGSGISRKHLSVKWETAGDIFITDLDSANGTFYQETRIPANRRIRMKKGAVLHLAGPKGIRIVLQAKASSSPKVGKKSASLPKRSKPIPAAQPTSPPPSGGVNAEIAVYLGGKRQSRLTLLQDETVHIGRKGFGADLEIAQASVSRRHARLRLRPGSVLELADAGSSNGTFVNGERISGQVLAQGDKITFGGAPSIEIRVEKLAAAQEKQRQLPVDLIPDLSQLFENHTKITLGRDPQNQVKLPHPTISRFHAAIEKRGQNQFFISDLGSRNGTRINGKLISKQIQITRSDVISLGPYEFTLATARENLLSERIKSKAAIMAKGLVTQVDRGKKTILHDTSLRIPEGEMIAIMGPSGCGKSTLMNALNGYFPATKGRVQIMGIDLNKQNYPYLKQFIGFVPQDDIVHRNLTVAQSLRFAAKLKLPDASNAEIKQRIQEVCENLKISDKDVAGIQKRRVSDLSGGQRKRVSIAVELLTKPRILFLDEPTSPLDPQTIDEFLDCLKNLTQPRNGEPGTTVVLVTHKPGDLEDMDKVIFMAAGGYLAYYGPVNEFSEYFNVKKVNEVYQQLSSSKSGPKFRDRWQATPEGRAATGTPPRPSKERAAKGKRESGIRQAWWLTRRYLNIKTNDRINTFLLFAQAPVIAGLTVAIFNSLTQGVFFMMAISAIWFGTNNAAREVVGEWAIYVRERMFNLKILPYLASKLLVLTLLSCIQAVVFVFIIWIGFSHPDTNEPLLQYPGLSILGMLSICFVSSLIGLLISVAVNNTEKVMTLVPLVVIPQILLSGMLAPIQEGNLIDWASRVTISRWSMELLIDSEGEIYEFAVLPPTPDQTTIYYPDLEETYVLKTTDELNGFPEPVGAEIDLVYLMTWGMIYFLFIILLLKRKDRM